MNSLDGLNEQRKRFGLTQYTEAQRQDAIKTGGKLDAGKPRFDLLPPEPLFELAKLYGQGAIKYADRAWEKGMSMSRLFGALMRHAWKWMRGEDYDDETGCHHMIAVAWNAFAIYTYHVRGIGQDDRPVKP